MNKSLVSNVLMIFLLLAKSNAYCQRLPEKKYDWKIGIQTSSWGLRSLEDAIKGADSCNVKYLEGLRNMPIGGGIQGNLALDMDLNKADSVCKMLDKAGIKLFSMGVVNPANELEWQQLFELAKALKFEEFATEPPPSLIPMIAKLAEQYKINVAIHNHPYPSYYWNPDTLIKYINGYTKYIGACADLGHWVRTGVDPAEALKKYNAAGIKIFETHFKDLNEKPNETYTAYMRSLPYGPWKRETAEHAPPGPHDVPWGTGISDIGAVIKELKRQHFKGYILAEYEWQRGQNTPEIKQSVINLRNKLSD